MGYFETNCYKKCIYPLYGRDCQVTCNCSKIDCWHVGGCTNSTWETAGSICDGYVNCFYTFTSNKIYDEFCLKLYLFNIFLWRPTGARICCNGYKWNSKETKCIRKLTYFILNFIIIWKKNVHIIPINFKQHSIFSEFISHQVVRRGTLGKTVRFCAFSLLMVWTVSQYAIVHKQSAILWIGVKDIQQNLV